MNYFGSADNRYDIYGIEYRPSDLFILDQAMYCLAACVPDELMSDRVVKDELTKLSFDLKAFYNQNYAYQPSDYENDRHGMIIYSGTKVSLRRYLNPDNSTGPQEDEDKRLYEKWLRSHICISTNALEAAKSAKHRAHRVPVPTEEGS